ncbi:MAG: MATE family efflux transporter [Clostridia bacterium]|nr:MATE family efflux transporter [Clostridia bacterium]
MEQRKENKMRTMPEGRLLLGMSIPLCISMLVQAFYNIVDSIFVAKISENALTAVSLAYPVQMLMIAVSVGTGVGFNALISRKLGEKRKEDAVAAANNGLMLMLLSALAFCLFGIFGAKPVFGMFTADEEIRALGTTYLSICCTFSFGVFLQIGAERILQSQGQNTAAMASQLIGAVTNIVLDPILIFGLLGFPKMGIAGAAVATVAGQIFGMLCCFMMLMLGKFEVKPSPKGFRPDKEVVVSIYRVGVPAIIMQAVGTVMNLMMNALLIAYTPTAVAVFGTFFKIQSLAFMPVFGMTTAAMSIIAFNYGAKMPDRVLRTRKLALTAALCWLSLGMLCFLLFPATLLGMFEASETMLGIGVPALRIMCLGFPFAAIGITNGTIFQGLNRGLYSMIVSLIRELVVLVPVAYLISMIFGKLGLIWWAVPIGGVVSALVSMYFFGKVKKEQIVPMQAAQNN